MRLPLLRLLAVPSALIAAAASAAPLPRFPSAAVWNQDVSAAALHPDSASMIQALSALGGFGNGRLQIDFSLHVVHADAGSPTRMITGLPPSEGGYFEPDCEPPGTAMPVPAHAAIEGQATAGDVSCDNTSEDCHLLVAQEGTLYEAYRADAAVDGELEAQCLAIWHLGVVYPPEGRGEHCTSADAAGFPMAPLLFNADEIAAALAVDASGDTVDLGHAIRFILPNARMASDPSLPEAVEGRLYVRPASHAGGPSGPPGSVPYGSRLRLRAGFPLTGYNPAARVVLNTLKRYGMVLADGGTVALTAESDLYTTAKWDDPGIGIDSRTFDLTPSPAEEVEIDDFEVVDTGPRIAET